MSAVGAVTVTTTPPGRTIVPLDITPLTMTAFVTVVLARVELMITEPVPKMVTFDSVAFVSTAFESVLPPIVELVTVPPLIVEVATAEDETVAFVVVLCATDELEILPPEMNELVMVELLVTLVPVNALSILVAFERTEFKRTEFVEVAFVVVEFVNDPPTILAPEKDELAAVLPKILELETLPPEIVDVATVELAIVAFVIREKDIEEPVIVELVVVLMASTFELTILPPETLEAETSELPVMPNAAEEARLGEKMGKNTPPTVELATNTCESEITNGPMCEVAEAFPAPSSALT